MEKNMTTIVKNQRKQFRPLDPTKVPVDSSVTWNYKNQYLLETDSGNFIWNDPFAGGDGTGRRCADHRSGRTPRDEAPP